MDSSSDETRFKIDYRRKTKIKSKDRQLPMINFQKRVIDFGDDQELFKIVAKLIMKRVDLDPDDLDPLLGDQSGPDTGGVIDLDALPAGEAPDDDPVPAQQRRRPLSERFGLRVYRHPDRYGAPSGNDSAS